jgi:hypothetical protein
MRQDQKTINWLIFEGKHSEEAPLPPPPPTPTNRPASPTLSMRSLKGLKTITRQESVSSKPTSTSPTKPKRLFGFFSTSGKSGKHSKLASPGSESVPRKVGVGEMGEALPEEQPKKQADSGRAQDTSVAKATIPAVATSAASRPSFQPAEAQKQVVDQASVQLQGTNESPVEEDLGTQPSEQVSVVP